MFPPFPSRESVLSNDPDPLTWAYRDVVVYDGPGPDDVLYEGPLVGDANGWLELEGNRLLSPSAVHHVDVYDDRDDELEGQSVRDGNDRGDGSGNDERSDDDRRTDRFSPF